MLALWLGISSQVKHSYCSEWKSISLLCLPTECSCPLGVFVGQAFTVVP